MREIKFRAWDKTAKEMYVWEKIDGDFLLEIMEGKHPDIVLMQYTGLKDKNGVEVYEGDVLKVTAILSDNSFEAVVEWDNDLSRFTTGNSPLSAYAKQSEVLGNIYQNPELLTK